MIPVLAHLETLKTWLELGNYLLLPVLLFFWKRGKSTLQETIRHEVREAMTGIVEDQMNVSLPPALEKSRTELLRQINGTYVRTPEFLGFRASFDKRMDRMEDRFDRHFAPRGD